MNLFFSTLAWLQPYKSVQVFVMFSFDNILEHVTASCPVFAQWCLFTVVCDLKRKKTTTTNLTMNDSLQIALLTKSFS